MPSRLLDHPLICNHCGKEITEDKMILSNKNCPINPDHQLYLYIEYKFNKTIFRFRCPYGDYTQIGKMDM